MSRYLFEDSLFEVLGFLASADTGEEEISDLDWIFTYDGKEDSKGISSCD